MLSLTLCQIQVIATDEAADSKYEILHGLEILEEKQGEYIKYDEFLMAVVRMIYDGEVTTENLDEVLRSIGLESFAGGTGYITADDACKIMVTVLGYSQAVSGEKYYQKASEIGLLKGTSSVTSKNLSFDNAVIMLYNMTETEVLEASFTPNLTLSQSGETLLEAAKNIEVINGIVTENAMTSLSGKSTLRNGEVKIGNYLCLDEKNISADMLGMNVEAYVQYDKTEDMYNLLYLYSEKTNIITLVDEDIEDVSEDFKTLSYIENDRTKSLKLNPVLKVIYNGQFYGAYTRADLMPESGEVKLIDNDSDGKYDVILVTSYEIMVVDRVSSVSSVIYNEYTHTGALTSIDVLNEDNDFTLKIIKDGAEAKISDIAAGDILNIARTKERADGYILIYVTRNTQEVFVNSVDLFEKTTSTDKGEFKLSDSFIREYTSNGKAAKGVVPGGTYTAYFDVNGELAALMTETDEYQYFLLIKAYVDETNEEIYLKGKDMEDEQVIYTLKKKVKYNGESANREVCYSDLVDAAGKTFVQVLQIKEKNGMIKEIRTAENTILVDEDKFTKTALSGSYRPAVNTFNNKIYIKGAKVIVTTSGESHDVKDYLVTDASTLKQDGFYNFTAYNVDEFGYTDLIMLKLTEAEYKEKYEVGTVYVYKINDVVRDDEIIEQLECFVSGYGILSVYSDEKGVFDGLAPGDRVSLSINDDGRVFYAARDFSISNMGGVSNETDIYTSEKNIYGKVEKVDVERKHVKLNCNGINSLNITGASVVIYHSESKEYENATVNDIEIDDYAYCTTSWSRVDSIYIVRKD